MVPRTVKWEMIASVKAIRVVVMLLMWSGFTTTTLYLWQSAGKEYERINIATTSATIDTVTTPSWGSTKADILELDDIFITVKTSGKFHESRLQVILKTWWNNCRNQTTFFTDATDLVLTNITDGRVLNTDCGDSHIRTHLCCKMGYEYDAFIDSGKKWWCHFDDDNYVNINALLSLLRQYDTTEDHYLGRPSLSFPIETAYIGDKVSFWFATGGAGVCISKSLGQKMSQWSRHGQFRKTCNAIKLPDDCTLGFIINSQLKVNLTIRKEFNSHLQLLKKISTTDLASQVTLSHSADQGFLNVLNIGENAAYSVSKDPTRFLSLHCLLQPETKWCPKSMSTLRNPQYIL